MSRTASPTTGRKYGLKRVCEVWGIARATLYASQKPKGSSTVKRGPTPLFSDEVLLEKIRQTIKDSPFVGEGHKKIHARLRKDGVIAGRNRVLKVMREHNLLSPSRHCYHAPKKHDGTIITDAPNLMWGTDGTKIFTLEDGWVWIFSVIDHWNAECLGWYVCKQGDRFAALEPILEALKRIYGYLGKDAASGLKLRMDHGSQYTSDYFLKQVKFYGIEPSFGFVGEPETNGVSERYHRTIKDQVMSGRIFRNVEEVREVMKEFVERYNEEWLVAKLGYKSPAEAREERLNLQEAA